jgi:hypothetical protein
MKITLYRAQPSGFNITPNALRENVLKQIRSCMRENRVVLFNPKEKDIKHLVLTLLFNFFEMDTQNIIKVESPLADAMGLNRSMPKTPPNGFFAKILNAKDKSPNSILTLIFQEVLNEDERNKILFEFCILQHKNVEYNEKFYPLIHPTLLVDFTENYDVAKQFAVNNFNEKRQEQKG